MPADTPAPLAAADLAAEWEAALDAFDAAAQALADMCASGTEARFVRAMERRDAAKTGVLALRDTLLAALARVTAERDAERERAEFLVETDGRFRCYTNGTMSYEHMDEDGNEEPYFGQTWREAVDAARATPTPEGAGDA